MGWQGKARRGIATAILGVTLMGVAATNALGASHGTEARVAAYFLRESYRPGTSAILVASTTAPWFSLQIFETGSLPIRGLRRDELNGTAVTEPQRVSVHRRRREQRFDVRT